MLDASFSNGSGTTRILSTAFIGSNGKTSWDRSRSQLAVAGRAQRQEGLDNRSLLVWGMSGAVSGCGRSHIAKGTCDIPWPRSSRPKILGPDAIGKLLKAGNRCHEEFYFKRNSFPQGDARQALSDPVKGCAGSSKAHCCLSIPTGTVQERPGSQ